MSEAEESLRMLIMLGNLVLPAAKEIVKMLVGTTARLGESVATHTKDAGRAAVREFVDRLDGAGGAGLISTSRLKGKEIAYIDMPEALNRADLKELKDACRALGVGFAVTEMGGKTALLFEAKNAAAMELATHELIDAYGLTEREVAEARSQGESPTRSEVANQEPQAFSRAGVTWKPEKGESLANPMWSAKLVSTSGTLEARVRADGTWNICNEDGTTAHNHAGELLAGKHPEGLFGACDLAKAFAALNLNKGLVEADKKAGYATQERLSKADTAVTVAHKATEAKKQAEKHTRTRDRKMSKAVSR